MLRPIVSIFLLLSFAFALTHIFATYVSLYWYYSWFDSVMHTWGGILIALGVYAFCTFAPTKVKPSLPLVLAALCVITITWEIFEAYAGLHNPATVVSDTSLDITVAFAGGLLTHYFLRRFRI